MNDICILCGIKGMFVVLNGVELFRCGRCDLCWRKNFDIVNGYYDDCEMNLSHGRIDERIANAKDRVKTFARYVDLNDLCDVGSGEGIFLKVLHERGYTNIIGIEPNSAALKFGRAWGIPLYQGTIDSFCSIIEGKHIRVATLFHVIEHLPDPLNALRKIATCLPQDGYIILETPDMRSYSFRKSGYRHKLIYEEHLFYFNRENLGELLKRSGFSVLAVGKRDFNQTRMPIHESLRKLGMLPFRGQAGVREGESLPERNVLVYASPHSYRARLIEFFKDYARPILSRLVMLLGRTDYLWIIVKKN